MRENGRQKVCVSGLMENEVHDLKALVQVSKAAVVPFSFMWFIVFVSCTWTVALEWRAVDFTELS